MTRVGFLGPRGTFAEEALNTQPDLAAGEPVPLATVPQVITAVERGDVDVGLVPIENSIEGTITVTIDTLAFDTDLLIQREIDLPVSLHLCAKPGTVLSDIRRVVSHPNPLGQSRGWLNAELPDAELVAANSTADAARWVAEAFTNDQASIGTAHGAELFGLEVLASEIEDHPENETRFVVVGTGVPAPTGHDKTSIVCFQREDRPGSLLAILQEFAARAINLTKLESRPTKRGLGQYCFFVDFEGHVTDEVVADGLRQLAATLAEVKFLGSYPVAGEEGPQRRRAAPSPGNRRTPGSRECAARSALRREHSTAMIDLRRLRDDPEMRPAIERKRVAPGLLDEVLALDQGRRSQQPRVDELRSRQKDASKAVGTATPEDREARVTEAAQLKREVQEAERALGALDRQLAELVLQVPNPADPSVPDGGEDDGDVLRVVGDTPPPPPLDHGALAGALGFVETDHAVAASGSRFASLMREAVLVELALVQWVMGRLVAEGFTPVVPPVLVREEAMIEAGFFPTDRSQVYEVDEGELFLVGTSEVPLSTLHRGERFAAEALPARYAAFSTCFRRESGTYGKDTTGIFRVHQFDKVEMFAWAMPDDSEAEHERLLAIEEGILSDLGLPYRVVNIAAGDLGAAAAKKYDLEVWLPSEGRYRELTSCSNYRDFSARRLGTRVKTAAGSEFVHTLNGTACAVGRTLVFCWEHYQDDGAFVVPDVLRPITGFDRVEPRAT